MFLKRKLAVSANYIEFGVLIYNGEKRKLNVPKGRRFRRVYEHKG